MKDIGGQPCTICHEIIPSDHACISGPDGAMCCSHEGQSIDVWELTHDGAVCIYRKKEEAAEDISSFKEYGYEYTFRKIKMKCTDVLSLGEFVGW